RMWRTWSRRFCLIRSRSHVFLPGGLVDREWMTLRPASGELRALTSVDRISVSFLISMNGRPTASSFTLVGTTGSVTIDLFHGYAYLASGEVSRTSKILAPFRTSLSQMSAATANLGWRAPHNEPAYPGLQRLVYLVYRAV